MTERSWMPSEEYGAYMASARWRATRAWAMELASGRCMWCRSPGPLNVHHRTYRNLGAEMPEDLVVLCRECHQEEHGLLPWQRPLAVGDDPAWVARAASDDPEVRAAVEDYERRIAEDRPYEGARPAAEVIEEAHARYGGGGGPG